MFFESILKRKEDIRRSIQGSDNELTHSGVRPASVVQNQPYPTWNNQ